MTSPLGMRVGRACGKLSGGGQRLLMQRSPTALSHHRLRFGDGCRPFVKREQNRNSVFDESFIGLGCGTELTSDHSPL